MGLRELWKQGKAAVRKSLEDTNSGHLDVDATLQNIAGLMRHGSYGAAAITTVRLLNSPELTTNPAPETLKLLKKIKDALAENVDPEIVGEITQLLLLRQPAQPPQAFEKP